MSDKDSEPPTQNGAGGSVRYEIYRPLTIFIGVSPFEMARIFAQTVLCIFSKAGLVVPPIWGLNSSL